MNDYTVALNSAECIKRASHFGYTKFHNICTGNTFDVPWGAVDWIGMGGITILGLVLLMVMVFLVLLLFSDL